MDSECRQCSAKIESGAGTCVLCLSRDLGITYRQLNYWSVLGYLKPERVERGRFGDTSGSPRVWPPEEQRVARLMGRLTAAGISLPLAAVIARKHPEVHEIAPGLWVQFREEEADGG